MKEYSNHITFIKNQTKQLEKDANQIMINLKSEIENIILGE